LSTAFSWVQCLPLLVQLRIAIEGNSLFAIYQNLTHQRCSRILTCCTFALWAHCETAFDS
jgi:hypothetical protein